MNIERVVDLTLPLTNEIPIYPGDPEPSIRPATTVTEHGYNTSYLHIGSHTGTHVDAPFHFRDDGETIDVTPLMNFIGEGVVIDVTGKRENEAITVDDVAPYFPKLGPGKIALFHTGWTKYLEEETYFEHPYIDVAVAEKLLALGVRTCLIDALNVDPSGGDHFPVHDAITRVNGIIGENFTNFHRIDFDRPLVLALPLKVAGGDGSPVRAVALKVAKGGDGD